MSSPMQHEIPVGGLLPILRRSLNLHSTNLLFHDYYIDFYQRFGITRDEMMRIMPSAMCVDVLAGTSKLKYVDEENAHKINVIKDEKSK